MTRAASHRDARGIVSRVRAMITTTAHGDDILDGNWHVMVVRGIHSW